jgi:hypothetical protein
MLAGVSGIQAISASSTPPQPTFPSPSGSTGVQPYGEFYPGTAYPGFLRNGKQVRFFRNRCRWNKFFYFNTLEYKLVY